MIRDNGGPGVHLTGADTELNFLLCNWIGVSDDGASAAPNDSHGVPIDGGAHNNSVGATFDTADTISGNGGDGVGISGGDANVVLGNYIGVNDGGGAAIANGISGVALVGSAANDNAGNVISGNAQAGVLVANIGSTGNRIDGNLNTLLNYPVITGGSGDTIMGTACVCIIYIYEAVGDPSAPGGGGVLIDSVATDAGSDWSATLPAGLTRFDVTVMAVDTSLNTSEMAPRPRYCSAAHSKPVEPGCSG